MLNQGFALRRLFDRHCVDHGIKTNIAIEADSLSILMEIVRCGRLSTVLPSSIAHTQPDLRRIPLTPAMPRHAVTLICRKNAYKSPACRAFSDLAVYACIRGGEQPELLGDIWPTSGLPD
jgi:LysR family cyn operon transcriptional activator